MYVSDDFTGEYGFLQEMRRTNVAMTRARRHLALIGDSTTIAKEPFIEGMISYCHKHGEVHSAHEYINGDTCFVMYLWYVWHEELCWHSLADDDFEQKLLYKPTSKSVGSVPEDKAVAKKRHSSSAHSRLSSSQVHAHTNPAPDKESTLVSDIT